MTHGHLPNANHSRDKDTSLRLYSLSVVNEIFCTRASLIVCRFVIVYFVVAIVVVAVGKEVSLSIPHAPHTFWGLVSCSHPEPS
jgi:hypothetical protein